MKRAFLMLWTIAAAPGALMGINPEGVPPLVIAVPRNGFGTTSSLEPLGLEWLRIPSSRYQQVYDASAFTRTLTGGGVISEIRFLSDESMGTAFVATAPAVEVRMSVTSRGPDELSSVFAENIGANEVIVFPRGALQFSSSGPGATTMGTRIPLVTPYVYDPSQGNLLIEILDYEQTSQPPNPFFWIGPLDAEDNLLGIPDTVSRVYAHDANAIVGTVDSVGLTTGFYVTPVPEPSAVILSLASVTAFAGFKLAQWGLRIGAGKQKRMSDVAD